MIVKHHKNGVLWVILVYQIFIIKQISMVKKVIITESQYARLTDYVNEAKKTKFKGNQPQPKNNSNSGFKNGVDEINRKIIPLFLDELHRGTCVNIILNNETINFLCSANANNEITLIKNTISKNRKLNSFNLFTIKFKRTGKKNENLSLINKDIIQTMPDETFAIKFIAYGKNSKQKGVWIQDISDIELSGCKKKEFRKSVV